MKLLLIRHSNAEERDLFARSGRSDDLRPLTTKGRVRMFNVSKALKNMEVEIRLVVVSPLVRSRQSGDILREVYSSTQYEVAEQICPGTNPEEILSWLKTRKEAESVAIIGHEPDLGVLATYLTYGVAEPRFKFKKAEVLLLETLGEVAPGNFNLQFKIPPKTLKAYSEATL